MSAGFISAVITLVQIAVSTGTLTHSTTGASYPPYKVF